MTLVESIRGRSHWEVVITPEIYKDNRITNLLSIPDLLRALAVESYGWDFPHVDDDERPIYANDWAEQGIEWKDVREVWRVKSNGQFRFIAGNRYDWNADRRFGPRESVSPEEQVVAMKDSLYRLTEFHEFAERYGTLIAKGENMLLDVLFRNFLGYRLVPDDSNWLGRPQRFTSSAPDDFKHSTILRPDAPVSARALARTATWRFFGRFGFAANELVLKEWQ